MARLFVEHLTVIDCAFLHAERGLVGESWIVDLEMEGELDDQGMVLDFGEVKRKLKKAIDGVADHRLLVPSRSPALDFALSAAGTGLAFRAATGTIEHIGPQKSICNIDADVVDEATVARQIAPWLERAVPKSVTRVDVKLRPERIEGAHYHYTHGLKKHEGQCQRIAHGHRSKIHVLANGRRDERLERLCADRWRDIYLGTAADIVAHGKGRIRFEYKAAEGEFALELPVERCDLLQTDTTVERIAEHLVQKLAGERPGTKLEVRAYEGVMKGAIATTR